MDFDKFLKGINKDLYRVADENDRKIERIDSGSYLLNAVLCGSIFGGFPKGLVTGIGGDPSTGKTFICLHAVKLFLENEPDGMVFYFDTESAIKEDVLTSHDIDTERVIILRPKHIEGFKITVAKILTNYLKDEKEDRQPMLIVEDSLGNLSSNKEVEDAIEGKIVNDMTAAKANKAVFRVIAPLLDEANAVMLVTNHQYSNVGGYGPAKKMSGGTGLTYVATNILSITKSAEKDGKQTIGSTITVTLAKGRHARENKTVELRIYHDHRGWDRYYGLAEYAVAAGVWKTASNGRYVTHEGTYFGKAIYKEPERFFTPDVLQAIDDVTKEEFRYGGGGTAINVEAEDDE